MMAHVINKALLKQRSVVFTLLDLKNAFGEVHHKCFNTFIQFIKQEKYTHLGFSQHDSSDRLFYPIHCFQFADDAAVVTSDERENRLLLNCFTRWCQWAYMQVCVEKCITF